MDVIVQNFVSVYGCYSSEVCLGLRMLSFGILFRSTVVFVGKFVYVYGCYRSEVCLILWMFRSEVLGLGCYRSEVYLGL
jgi:hypothetical protein